MVVLNAKVLFVICIVWTWTCTNTSKCQSYVILKSQININDSSVIKIDHYVYHVDYNPPNSLCILCF